MVDRQKRLEGEDSRAGLLDRAPLRIFEDVVGKPVVRAQRRAIDCMQCGEVRFRGGPLPGKIIGGEWIADRVGAAEIAAEEGSDRVAPQKRLVGAFEQGLERGAIGRRVDRRSLGGERRWSGRRNRHGLGRRTAGEAGSDKRQKWRAGNMNAHDLPLSE